MHLGIGNKYKIMLKQVRPIEKAIDTAISVVSCGSAVPNLSKTKSFASGHSPGDAFVQFMRRDKNVALCSKDDV